MAANKGAAGVSLEPFGVAVTLCCVWPAGCESSTVWLPTRGLLAPRWVFTYKNGLSSGHNGCYGRVSAPCKELGFVYPFNSMEELVQQASWREGCLLRLVNT